jgi:RNA polymerase sigma-70 factor (ECF subfamily)
LARFAVWLTRDSTIAEDVVQEAMLRAWRSRSGLRDPTAVRAWLFTIVRREHARLYERKQLPLVCIDVCVAREDAGLALYDEDPQIEELRKTLLRLPEEYRVPLVMQVLGGFSTAEIATELGLSVNAVLTRLFRARHQLREIYGNPTLEADAAPAGAG